MLLLAGRRLASMLLIMIVISILLFLAFEGDKLALAGRVLGQYTTLEGKLNWIEENGYNRPRGGALHQLAVRLLHRRLENLRAI
jgi:peptide/nickel transport system permease protein